MSDTLKRLEVLESNSTTLPTPTGDSVSPCKYDEDVFVGEGTDHRRVIGTGKHAGVSGLAISSRGVKSKNEVKAVAKVPPQASPDSHNPSLLEAGNLPKRLDSSVNSGRTAVDLFCGCGGLSLGLKQADFSVIGAVDVDSLAVETYRANHESVKVWERDIRKVKIAEVMRSLGIRKGELDLLAGCPPCQGFSSMRTLNGGKAIDDPQNDLIFEFLRFVRGLKPKAVMLENVPGLAEDRRLAAFKEGLEKLGYASEHAVLDASGYGVPQRRRRLILLAGRKGTIAFGQNAPRKKTVAETIGGLPPAGESGDPLHDLPECRGSRVRAMISKIPKDGGSRTALGEDFQLECHKKCHGFKDVYGRMKWNDVAPTITGGCVNPSKGRFLHPAADRAITLREAALLQTFPLGYHFSLRRGKHQAALLIGNALPPEFIRVHAKEVHVYLDAAPSGKKPK
jgi:DNA (cytosine-5)-methyltransferase 1